MVTWEGGGKRGVMGGLAEVGGAGGAGVHKNVSSKAAISCSASCLQCTRLAFSDRSGAAGLAVYASAHAMHVQQITLCCPQQDATSNPILYSHSSSYRSIPCMCCAWRPVRRLLLMPLALPVGYF